MNSSYGFRWITVALFVCLTACKSGQEGQASVVYEPAPESFVFFDLGANSRLTDGVARTLVDALGNYGREAPSTIHLEIRYDGFLERYYPDLFELNRRLNRSRGARAEYDVIKLTFRNASRKGSPFDVVETIFHAPTGRPFLFKCRTRQDVSGLPDALREKYGEPVSRDLEDDAGRTLTWRKNGDVLIFSIFRGRYVEKEYDLMIVYRNSIERMLKEEEERASRKEREKDKDIRQVF